MPRWFLSYHSPDQALAERLKAAIERKDPASRVFFAPAHLRAGRSWSAQLVEEIAEATAFVLLIGAHGLGDWQVYEYDEALDRRVKSPDFPLVVVLLEGQTAPGLPFLRRLHWIIAADPASDEDVARLLAAAAGGGPNQGELWRYASPYRGLEAMEEKDSDYFFGRRRETIEVLSALSSAPDRLPVLIGNSGVGKSSLAQAGVLAALKRQAWPDGGNAAEAWPAPFHDSRQWCFLSLKPGSDPLKALVDSFLDTWQYSAADPERVRLQRGWQELFDDNKATLRDLIDATERRRQELDQSKPPGFFLYLDQGEELYVRTEERDRRRFSELIASALHDPRLHAMMSLRSDFLGQLQNDEPLFKARHQIDVPPLRETELREIVSRPAQQLGARFEAEGLINIITRRTAEDSVKDVGALPLLSYTLDDMWTQMVRRGDGTLRLPAQSFELGGVLVDRANNFLATHPGIEAALQRVLTLKLATVLDDGEPTRRRAVRSEFSDDEWRLVSALANYPNRLLVIITTEAGQSYAEVAHEAIFRRWAKLREWIAGQRDFLAWRSGVENARRTWQATPPRLKKDALLMGVSLDRARDWLDKRFDDIPAPDRDFIAVSRKAAQQRSLTQGAIASALIVISLLLGWLAKDYVPQLQRDIATRNFVRTYVTNYVTTAKAEATLKSGGSFRECGPLQQEQDYCPTMIVVPAGSFTIGSPVTEVSRLANEGPQTLINITRPFAVSEFELTFDEWQTCARYGDCNADVSDIGFGRGQQPVINVSWQDAQTYAAWLSRITGKNYRLLAEAEYEYAARGGSQTAYPWGNDIGTGNTNCSVCGSKWDSQQPAPVGSFAGKEFVATFPANGFGLRDMVGNISEWVADCYHPDYVGQPADGSEWTQCADTRRRVVRGGSWRSNAGNIRSAYRSWDPTDVRYINLGFRVARTIGP